MEQTENNKQIVIFTSPGVKSAKAPVQLLVALIGGAIAGISFIVGVIWVVGYVFL